MSDTTVLFLAADGTIDRWRRSDGRAILADGEGVPPADEAMQWVAIAPAPAVTLHWAELPDRSPAQAVAAARLLVAEASAAPPGSLHVAVGDEGMAERPIAVVAVAEMDRWLAALAVAGIDPVAIIPAPMLLPRPDAGYMRGDPGGGAVVRGPGAAFADESGLTELIVADEPLATLDATMMTEALLAAIAAPPLDLRQGPYARRRRRTLDWALVRRLGWLIAAILLVTLLIDIARIVRYDLAASALDAQAETLARSGLPPGETVNDAGRQLAIRLSRARGAGAGFSRTAAAAFSAVRAVPGTAVTSLQFDDAGALHLSLTAAGEGQANDLVQRIKGYGFIVTPGAFTSAEGGKVSGELTVKAP